MSLIPNRWELTRRSLRHEATINVGEPIMKQPPDTGRTREQGIEFGALDEKLTGHEYPTTCDELIDAYGTDILSLPNGEQTLGQVLKPLQNEQFDSPEDVRHAVFTMVSEKAIGRKAYSDRTPPALGEERPEPQQSF